tara:strand:+ start:168 stop:365 length:198 start_codon:yes stop_codon:yes gene_type:complete
MKNAKKIESNLCCKATASLGMEIQEELTKKDKSLGNLLDEKENKDENPSICGRSKDNDKGCGNSI